jgi:hypothetical protein
MAVTDKNNNDYISAQDYNELCNEIGSAKSSRGLGSTKPSPVNPGDAITQSHITALQDSVNNTVRYGSQTRYSFNNQQTSGPPLALLYNQVRQVVVDLQTNQCCVTCANACRQGCSINCYANCGSGCSTGCSGCYTSCTGCGGCTGSCGTGCTGCGACSGGCGSGCTTGCIHVPEAADQDALDAGNALEAVPVVLD